MNFLLLLLMHKLKNKIKIIFETFLSNILLILLKPKLIIYLKKSPHLCTNTIALGTFLLTPSPSNTRSATEPAATSGLDTSSEGGATTGMELMLRRASVTSLLLSKVMISWGADPNWTMEKRVFAGCWNREKLFWVEK